MRSLTVKVFLILLLAAGTALSQDFHIYGFSMYNMEFMGSGARARGLGGAFLGVSDDASALTWNPAGLVQIGKAQISAAGSVVRLKTENDVAFASKPQDNFLSEYTKDLLNLASGSFVAPVRIKGHPFVAAANYHRIIDDNDQFKTVQNWALGYATLSGAVAVDTTNQYRDSRMLRNLHDFSLGFGTGLYGDLSFGLAANIYYGNGLSEYYSAATVEAPLLFGDLIIDSVRMDGFSTVRDEQSYTGFNFTGSLMYRTPKVRAGISVRTPYELSVEHDIKRADTLYVKSTSVSGPGSPFGSPRPTLYRGKTKMEFPLIIGVGAAVQATPNFLLSADVELRSTSSTTYFVRSEDKPDNPIDAINSFTLPISMYYSDSTPASYFDASGDLIEIFDEFDLQYESSMQLRFGAEYMLTTSYGTIPLRGGIRFTQMPYRDVSGLFRIDYDQVFEGFELGDKVTRTSYAFGSGIRWSQIWLDVTVEMNKEEQSEDGVMVFDDFDIYQYSNTHTKTVPSVNLTFTGFF